MVKVEFNEFSEDEKKTDLFPVPLSRPVRITHNV